MKLKYHKIRNVPKEVCTAEQMIAYNLAFRAHISFQDQFDKAKTISQMCVSDLIHDIVDFEMNNYQNAYTYKEGKYNLDAIQSALNAGLEKYLTSPYIATDYKKVGETFPAYYL